MKIMNMELQQAVAAVTTNDIFKKMIKANKTIDKRNFLRMLNVDVKTVTPIYFNEQVYKKNEHSNNWFLFLDKEFLIVGILLGNTWKKDYSEYEYYMPQQSSSSFKYQVVKNRKKLTEASYHILMITPEMQFQEKWTIKESKPLITSAKKAENKAREARESLQRRLLEYKRNKYDNLLTNERAKEMITELILYLSSHMFQEDKITNFSEKSYEAFGWHNNNIFDTIVFASKVANQLHINILEYEKEKTSEYYREDWSYELNRIRESKIKIAKAYSSFELGEV